MENITRVRRAAHLTGAIELKHILKFMSYQNC